MFKVIKFYDYNSLLLEIKNLNKTYEKLNNKVLKNTFFDLDVTKTYEEVLIHKESLGIKVKAITHCCNLAKEYKNKQGQVKKHDGVIIGVLRSDGTVSLKDGNHRAAAYIIAGFDEIPVVLI